MLEDGRIDAVEVTFVRVPRERLSLGREALGDVLRLVVRRFRCLAVVVDEVVSGGKIGLVDG